MKLTRDVVAEVLEEYAPSEFATRDLPDAYQTAIRAVDDPLLRRALNWAGVLQRELLARLPLWTAAEVSLGFLYLSPEVRFSRERRPRYEMPVFGVGLYDPPGSWMQRYPMRDGYTVARVRGREVPIVLRQGVIELHNAPPQILGATTTCWESRRQGDMAGVLTASHVLGGLRVGDPVPLVGGQSGVLAGVGPLLVDAAYIELGHERDPGSPQLALLRLPAMGTPVKFTGSTSGVVDTTIAEVVLSRHTLDAWVPQRVMLDRAGAAGDSGALVTARPSGSGVALYCGGLPVGLSTPLGVCQLLTQAAEALSLTLYEP